VKFFGPQTELSQLTAVTSDNVHQALQRKDIRPVTKTAIMNPR